MSTPAMGYLPDLAPAGVKRVRALLGPKGELRHAGKLLLKAKAPGGPVVLHERARKLLGDYLPAQKQTRGTCVGRGAKRAVDLLQADEALEAREKGGLTGRFVPVSHSWIYAACRQHAGYLNAQDGAVGAWAAWSVANDGVLASDDAGDADDSDDTAVLWGQEGVPVRLRPQAKRQIVQAVALVKTTGELAQALAQCRPVTVASTLGFEPFVRDEDGVVASGGYWPHQMCFTGYAPDLAGRGEAFLVDQSWGAEEPRGPLGPYPIPPYSFWVLAADARRMLAAGDSWAFDRFAGWPRREPDYLV
jgi:hypothetical protein